MDLSTRLKAARRRAGGRAIHAMFHTLSSVGKLHPLANPAKHGVEVISDVRYGPEPGEAHLLDVYRPIGAEHAPVVFFVHGGGFRILSKDTHWLMALAYARAGYVVFTINYRLAPKHPFPAGLQDAARAWLWVIDNAAAYGGDVSRTVFSGESAGANLSLSLTLASCFERPEPWARAVFDANVVPQAVIPSCGILEVSNHERLLAARPNMPQIVADRIGEVARGYLAGAPANVSRDLADPLVVLERDEEPNRPLPPMFISCGTADPLLDDSRRLAAALDRRDVPHRLEVYPGEVHAFHAFVWRQHARDCWTHTYEFLDAHAPA